MKMGALLSGTDPRAIKIIVATYRRRIGDRFMVGIKKEKIDISLKIDTSAYNSLYLTWILEENIKLYVI